MSPCRSPLTFETLVAYWAGDLEPARTDEVDEHLFACAYCTETSARIAAITERIRGLVPPFVGQETVAALRARGLLVEDNLVAPEAHSHVTFTKQDFIIHHLTGLALEDAERVGVEVRVEETGELLAEEPSAPFDREAGEVLIACQRHFVSFPPNVVFHVTVKERSGDRIQRFFVAHTFVLT
jgi:hypothetical protein